jgi:hypothetical protein
MLIIRRAARTNRLESRVSETIEPGSRLSPPRRGYPRFLRRSLRSYSRRAPSGTGVQVNGIRLAKSTPCNCDGAGRPLFPYSLKDYILGPGEVLLMSDYNPASFDSRYFGPLQETTIESIVTPLLTWN